MISWLTSCPDQDRFLVESGELKSHPLVNDRSLLKEGLYLDIYNRKFPGCEEFYRERANHFQMDHGMVLVRHQKNYIETGCFSGLSEKRPLYQLFMNEQALFKTFIEHFTTQLDIRLIEILSQGILLNDLKGETILVDQDALYLSKDREKLLQACGCQNLPKTVKKRKAVLKPIKRWAYLSCNSSYSWII